MDEPLLSVREALGRVLAAVPTLGSERLSLAAATGRVLRGPLRADRALPPYDRVMMDGIAVAPAAWARGERRFRLAGTQAAGQPVLTLPDEGSAFEVMTGAVCPRGAAIVVPVELLTIADGIVAVDTSRDPTKEPGPGRFLHPAGSDAARGDELVPAGVRLGAREVAVAASVGAVHVEVTRQPRVAVFATGDELVRIDSTPEPHQVRQSNAWALRAALLGRGIQEVNTGHLPDDPAIMRTRLGKAVAENDLVLVSGGASRGKFDHLPSVLTELGVRKIFHGVAQRPGKPLWFGATDVGTLVFNLPGNPVSTLSVFRRYVVPALVRMTARRERVSERRALAEAFRFPPPLTLFLPVCRENKDTADNTVRPRPSQNSGDFAALVGTDGFVELPAERDAFAAGEAFPFFPWEEEL